MYKSKFTAMHLSDAEDECGSEEQERFLLLAHSVQKEKEVFIVEV